MSGVKRVVPEPEVCIWKGFGLRVLTERTQGISHDHFLFPVVQRIQKINICLLIFCFASFYLLSVIGTRVPHHSATAVYRDILHSVTADPLNKGQS